MKENAAFCLQLAAMLFLFGGAVGAFGWSVGFMVLGALILAAMIIVTVYS